MCGLLVGLSLVAGTKVDMHVMSATAGLPMFELFGFAEL
jgi:hypothetical protein